MIQSFVEFHLEEKVSFPTEGNVPTRNTMSPIIMEELEDGEDLFRKETTRPFDVGHVAQGWRNYESKS